MDQENPTNDQPQNPTPGEPANPAPQPASSSGPSNAGSHKAMAIIAYIIFFVPLLTDAKNDPFVKYHVKQGLVLAIAAILISILQNILPYGLYWIFSLLNLGIFILFIMGIIHASQDKQEPLPLIGQFADKFKF